jgi:TRAP-type uncharacterized transport system substrate-binding protein
MEDSGSKSAIFDPRFSVLECNPAFCPADLPTGIAYNMARAIDLCHEQIPVDHFDKRPMTMREFCRGGEAGQLNIPLHPGAKKYYREEGYV